MLLLALAVLRALTPAWIKCVSEIPARFLAGLVVCISCKQRTDKPLTNWVLQNKINDLALQGETFCAKGAVN